MRLSPDSVLSNQHSLHEAMPELDEDDRKLVGLRVVPFANQLVSTQFSVSHAALDRISRRSAGLVFVIGLLATAAVVAMSRRSELQLRGLNQALRQESRTDGLTRIANRRAWDEALALEENRRQRHGHFGARVHFNFIGAPQFIAPALRILGAMRPQHVKNFNVVQRVAANPWP